MSRTQWSTLGPLPRPLAMIGGHSIKTLQDHLVTKEMKRTGFSSHFIPYSFRYCCRSSIIGPRSRIPRATLRGMFVKKRTASLVSGCCMLHLKQASGFSVRSHKSGEEPGYCAPFNDVHSIPHVEIYPIRVATWSDRSEKRQSDGR